MDFDGREAARRHPRRFLRLLGVHDRSEHRERRGASDEAKHSFSGGVVVGAWRMTGARYVPQVVTPIAVRVLTGPIPGYNPGDPNIHRNRCTMNARPLLAGALTVVSTMFPAASRAQRPFRVDETTIADVRAAMRSGG